MAYFHLEFLEVVCFAGKLCLWHSEIIFCKLYNLINHHEKLSDKKVLSETNQLIGQMLTLKSNFIQC